MIHTTSIGVIAATSACDVIISPLRMHKNGRCDDMSDLLYLYTHSIHTTRYIHVEVKIRLTE